MGVLDDKVVLITGGGRGIGRECALLAAREGAKVVVNDLGTGLKGDDEGGESPADEVVREIRAVGGTAVSDGGSITRMNDVKAMVERAMDEFGGLHAVINPAGILRDSMFHKMTEDDWDLVIEVHLKGAFNVCRATIEHFRQQQDGAYVLFASTTGLIGNIAQANYGAAKLGVSALSHIIAMENAGRNVRSNVVAPFAWTRMVASIPVKDEASAQRVERFRSGMRAEQVAPLAVALAAPGAGMSGQIFGARGNEVMLFSQPRPVQSSVSLSGWSASALIDQVMPKMQSFATGLEPSASVFNYDPF